MFWVEDSIVISYMGLFITYWCQISLVYLIRY